ncbi:MAG: DUF4129 domain-containing protein [Flavobacteriales bacterium]
MRPFLLFIFTLFMLLANNRMNAQSANPAWTDDQWKKAIEDIEYKEKKKEQEKEETNIEQELDFTPSNFDGSWLHSTTTKVIIITLLIALLIFTIFKLIDRNVSVNKKIPESILQAREMSEEELIEQTMDDLISQAIAAGDYRLAIRFLYIQTIQSLNIYKFIQWKKDKTNKDYLREMRSHEKYKHFRELTLVYEVVWYGDHSIEASRFETVNALFNDFNTYLSLEQKK